MSSIDASYDFNDDELHSTPSSPYENSNDSRYNYKTPSISSHIATNSPMLQITPQDQIYQSDFVEIKSEIPSSPTETSIHSTFIDESEHFSNNCSEPDNDRSLFFKTEYFDQESKSILINSQISDFNPVTEGWIEVKSEISTELSVTTPFVDENVDPLSDVPVNGNYYTNQAQQSVHHFETSLWSDALSTENYLLSFQNSDKNDKLPLTSIKFNSKNADLQIQFRSQNAESETSEIFSPNDDTSTCKLVPTQILLKECTECNCPNCSVEGGNKVIGSYKHLCHHRKCSKLFESPLALQAHLQLHERPRVCNEALCDKSYKQEKQLLRHKKIHTVRKSDVDKQYICSLPTCGKKFNNRQNFARHMKIHSGKKNFACLHCGSKFMRSDHLKKHFDNLHKRVDNSM